jgi:hypothetical protein
MRPLALLLALASASVSAQTPAEPAASGEVPESVVILVAPEAVGASAALGAAGEAWAPPEAVVLERAPHGRAAWQGFKTGAIVGGTISAVGLAAALIADANGACVDAHICAWHLAAIGSIPVTLVSAVVGSGIGWTISVASPRREERHSLWD